MSNSIYLKAFNDSCGKLTSQEFRNFLNDVGENSSGTATDKQISSQVGSSAFLF